jgi:hypothetical protein
MYNGDVLELSKLVPIHTRVTIRVLAPRPLVGHSVPRIYTSVFNKLSRGNSFNPLNLSVDLLKPHNKSASFDVVG